MAQFISEDVLRHIASFLPYNERVEMNRALPFHYRFVKKLNSDEHNAQYKQDLLRGKLEKFDRTLADSVERVKVLKQMMLYLLHTRDSYLFSHENLKNVTRRKAGEFSNVGTYGNLVITNWRTVKSCMSVATQLLSKLDTIPISKNKKIIGRRVEIL